MARPSKSADVPSPPDLPGRPEGDYNVRVTSRYPTHSGKVVTIKTTRNLSVVCS